VETVEVTTRGPSSLTHSRTVARRRFDEPDGSEKSIAVLELPAGKAANSA